MLTRFRSYPSSSSRVRSYSTSNLKSYPFKLKRFEDVKIGDKLSDPATDFNFYRIYGKREENTYQVLLGERIVPTNSRTPDIKEFYTHMIVKPHCLVEDRFSYYFHRRLPEVGQFILYENIHWKVLSYKNPIFRLRRLVEVSSNILRMDKVGNEDEISLSYEKLYYDRFVILE